jgi:hypothetical protein
MQRWDDSEIQEPQNEAMIPLFKVLFFYLFAATEETLGIRQRFERDSFRMQVRGVNA